VVGANGEVEEEDTDDDSSCDGQTLVNTEEDKAEHRKCILCREEVDVSVAHQEIHEGVDFPGSFFNMEDREIGVENGKQDNEEEQQQEVVAIEVNVYVAFSIRFSPNRSPATEENISAGRFRRLLPPIPSRSPILFELGHCLYSNAGSKNDSNGSEGPPKSPPARITQFPLR